MNEMQYFFPFEQINILKSNYSIKQELEIFKLLMMDIKKKKNQYLATEIFTED